MMKTAIIIGLGELEHLITTFLAENKVADDMGYSVPLSIFLQWLRKRQEQSNGKTPTTTSPDTKVSRFIK